MGCGLRETSRRQRLWAVVVGGLGTSLRTGCRETSGFPTGGVTSNVGSHSFEVLGRSQDDVVESRLPGEIEALQIPPDPFRGLGFETANRSAQGLRAQELRIFQLVLWSSALKDQNAVHVIGHDDPFV